MHELIILASLFILFCCKSSQPFFEYIHSQRVITGHHHINSQIKLQPIDEVRIINIPGDHMFIINFKLRNVINEINSSSSREAVWFDNPKIWSVSLLGFTKIVLELLKLGGQ